MRYIAATAAASGARGCSVQNGTRVIRGSHSAGIGARESGDRIEREHPRAPAPNKAVMPGPHLEFEIEAVRRIGPRRHALGNAWLDVFFRRPAQAIRGVRDGPGAATESASTNTRATRVSPCWIAS